VSGNSFVDVADVRIEAAMSMPGMAMAAQIQSQRLGEGRYQAAGVFGMAGGWHFTISWNEGAERKSIRFERAVQ
jgi:hypothetical protein